MTENTQSAINPNRQQLSNGNRSGYAPRRESNQAKRDYSAEQKERNKLKGD